MSKGRRFRIFGIVATVVVVLGASAVLVQQKMGKGGNADAADSTAVAQSGKSGQGKDKDEKKEVLVPVEISAVATRDIPAYFQATGALEARRQVDLLAKAQGQVTRLNFEEGDFVKQGDVLLELDPREEKILFEQSKVRAETALRELERTRELAAKGLAADRELESMKETADLAVYERDLAQVRLDDTIIRTPFSGQVTVRNVELGQSVNPGTPLLGLADVSPLEVKLFLPEQVVKDLKVGQPVEIRPDVAPDDLLAGKVSMIAPVVDPATSTVKITLQVDNMQGRARVGSFVRARITTDIRHDAVSVPKRALVPEAGATYVFIAESDTVRRVPVSTGYADESHVEVLTGLDVGQRVVTVGQGGLRNGSKIRDLAAAPASDTDSSEMATVTDKTEQGSE